MPSFFLAWQYLLKRRRQAASMIAGVALAIYLPLATHWLVGAFDKAIGARADSTPMVVGAKGSQFDLVLHGLYFRANVDDTIPFGEYETLAATGLAQSIPLHAQFTAAEQPVVGTTLDYFEFRKLHVSDGKQIAFLGDCVLGASAAKKLKLRPGDKLKTDSGNLFDLASEYPIQLNITGLLNPNGTADDEAVFVDVKTAWIIAGIGHGHNEDEQTSTSKKLVTKHLEITAENNDSFHFHGDPNAFPLTAILAIPKDNKSTALVLTRYQDNDRLQALKPTDIVTEMMDMVMSMRKFLYANYALVATATGLLLILIVGLSRRLRAPEMETMFLLGCSRSSLFGLQAAELAIIFAASIALALLAAWASVAWAQDYLNTLTG